jgi:hypothetical protein
MRNLALLLLPAALFAGQPRYARLGEFSGPVEVQLQPADSWMPAQRNLPLPELAWIRTGAAARVEIEFDDGSVWRLGPQSQGEISDSTRLSTGQRVTLLSLDRGLAYFTGQPGPNDSLSLAVPGAQAVFTRAAKLRLEALGDWSQISVLEGSVRFSSPAAEMDLREGLCARVEPGNREQFLLERKIPGLDLDAWSAERDKLAASTTAQHHVVQHYGLVDLDAAGTWVDTEQFGAVWKPKTADGWLPFQKGRWRWYDTLGFTWVSDEPWGWLPYHYGRWSVSKTLGWFWAPSVSQTFKPGEVFWLLGAQVAGWGPLAPGERWTAAEPPELFAVANMTFATLTPDSRTVDPASLGARPEKPLEFAAFALALPSPTFPASRLDALRPAVQAGSTRLKPVLAGVSYGSDPEPPPQSEPEPEPSAPPPAAMPTPSAEAPPSDSAAVADPGSALDGIFTKTSPRRDTRASTSKAAAPKAPSTPPQPTTRSRERELYDGVMEDGNDPAKLLKDLQNWSREFPHSSYADERTALYIQAYASVKPPQSAKVLDLGAELMARNLQSLFPDPQRGPTLILSVLYSMALSSWNVPHASSQQTQAGLAAARQLLTFAPTYFVPSRRPAGVTAESWAQTRTAIETAARQTVALLTSGGGPQGKPAGSRN